jgi:hypothetical protein
LLPKPLDRHENNKIINFTMVQNAILEIRMIYSALQHAYFRAVLGRRHPSVVATNLRNGQNHAKWQFQKVQNLDYVILTYPRICPDDRRVWLCRFT